MKKEKIVTGQKVTPQKVQRARELRREMTSAKRRLWNRIRANRLGGWHFRRQQIIDGFIVDFYCHKAGLVVEVDGPIHQRQKLADSERTQALAGRGLKVIRLTNREVMNNIQQVVKSILIPRLKTLLSNPLRGDTIPPWKPLLDSIRNNESP